MSDPTARPEPNSLGRMLGELAAMNDTPAASGGMLFVPTRQGMSHVPAEWTALDARLTVFEGTP